MPKNIKEIMVALDNILTTTVWVNGDRQIVSLADELHIGAAGAPRSIEDLPRASLVGAYVSLQIRSDNFDVAAECLETEALGARVKEMVFAAARVALESNNVDSEKVARAA
ncbi:MAG: hypothetical protein LBL75_00380 [Rickettsiales bacterium]|jgi:hypothetical protein|nr:hypothetical protein [Rickettsiales bacterium]